MNDLDSFETVSNQVDEKLQGDGLNMLINNAGVLARDNIDDVTAESMMQVYKINTVGPLMLTKVKQYISFRAVFNLVYPVQTCRKFIA